MTTVLRSHGARPEVPRDERLLCCRQCVGRGIRLWLAGRNPPLHSGWGISWRNWLNVSMHTFVSRPTYIILYILDLSLVIISLSTYVSVEYWLPIDVLSFPNANEIVNSKKLVKQRWLTVKLVREWDWPAWQMLRLRPQNLDCEFSPNGKSKRLGHYSWPIGSYGRGSFPTTTFPISYRLPFSWKWRWGTAKSGLRIAAKLGELPRFGHCRLCTVERNHGSPDRRQYFRPHTNSVTPKFGMEHWQSLIICQVCLVGAVKNAP